MLAILSFLSLAVSALALPAADLVSRSTGNTIPFTLNLTYGDWAPVGAGTRKAIFSNGTIPGPALHMTVGDTVQFLVHNNLPNETSIHFHGVTQLNTPWSDGVPGISQKPIQPGQSFLYQWTADESGTYFYHAHYKAQIMDGLYGAIVIAPKAGAEQPFALISNNSADIAAMQAAEKVVQPVFVSDYSQYTSKEFYNIQVAGNIDDACADSILVNGMGSVYCLTRDEITANTPPQLAPLLAAVNPPQLTDKACLPPNLPATQGNFTFDINAIPADAYEVCTPSTGPMANITVDASKGWAALSFISTSGFSALKFTIDGHKFYVYAVDGQYVTPALVDQVAIDNGERYSIMVQLDQPVAQYAIRVANNGLNQLISGFAVLNYLGSTGPASTDPNALAAMNFAGVNTTAVTPYVPDVMAIPFPTGVDVPAPTADVTYNFAIEKLGQPFGAYQWTLTGVDGFNQTEEDTTPYLFQQPSAIPASDLIITTKTGQWVDLILKTIGPLAQPHPMHKHSNKAFILGQGVGDFNYTTVAEAQAAMPAGTFNMANPPYRDGFTTTPAEGNSTWMALRYQVINPGAFIFHCHMQTHFSGGMAVAILDGVDAWPSVPPQYLYGTGLTGQLSLTKKTHSS